MALTVDDKIKEIEEKVSNLREERNAFKIEIQNLRDHMDELHDVVKHLVSTIDRSKGALWIIGGVSALVGAVFHYLSVLYHGNIKP